ncbi:formyltransferase family protein [Pseudomonadales bacterium]|nr:formyltransferase family protein [Pseudomonadales bacterium]
MKKVFFLLNDISEFEIQHLCEKYLSDYIVSKGTELPDNPGDFSLIVPWNYKKIIRNYELNNIVIFHSSDLPSGKGWAPIFNAFNENLKYYVISAVLLSERVDSGPIVAKAKFKIKNTYTAEITRKIDEEIVLMMAAEIIERFDGKELTGIEQNTLHESYYKRRYPKDNEVNGDDSLNNLIYKLKGCEESHPAFFNFKGDEFVISVKPKIMPSFPEDLQITFL